MAQWKPKRSKRVFGYTRSQGKSIPIKRVHGDGIFEHNGEFTMCGTCPDVNYMSASTEDKQFVFANQQEMIKSLPMEELAKTTIINWPVQQATLETDLFMQECGDGFDEYRDEMNEVNRKRATEGTNNIRQERYLTISTRKKKLRDVKSLFNRVENSVKNAYIKMGSDFDRLDTLERIRLLYNFFRTGQEQFFNLDLDLTRKRGHSIRDCIAPGGFLFADDYIKVGKRYGRVLTLRDYPAYLQDTLITDLTSLPKQMMLSIDYITKSKEDSRRVVEKKRLAVDTEIAKATKNATQMGNYNATIPPNLEEKRKGFDDILNLIKMYDQRIVWAQITILHMADSMEELDQDTDTLISIGQGHMCQLENCTYQMEKAFNTVMPYGLRYIDTLRTLSCENAATLIPFLTKDLWDKGGMCVGVNPISKKPVVVDQKQAASSNAFILGITGSGKSMFAKLIMAYVMLNTGDDVLLVDPEREMKPMVDMFLGTFLHFSAGSPMCLNALETMRHCEKGDDPISLKCEFILTFIENAIGTINTTPAQRSIIDRCSRRLLMMAAKDNMTVTLENLYRMIKEEPEKEAADIVAAMELYVHGSLNSFAKPTSKDVDMSNRLVCFDIRDLGEKSKTLAMLVLLDAIQARVAYNRSIGKRTWVFIDEMWLMFRYGLGEWFDSFWRRIRKYGAIGVGITQNVSSMLNTDVGRDMLGNSEFTYMFNQAHHDRKELAALLDISETQMKFITNSEPGVGLLRRSSVIVPFDGKFDTDTKLYKAMTTKIEEVEVSS